MLLAPILVVVPGIFALSDLDTAAITVYRNPEFFRHLSNEFNDHVNLFAKDPPLYGPRDAYVSPVEEDNYFHQFNQEFGVPSPTSTPEYLENQENDGEENGADEELQNEDEDVNEDIKEDEEPSDFEDHHQPNHREEYNDNDDDQYKYPGEPKKPNKPIRPNVNVHFDRSPDFGHPPRIIPPSKTPKKPSRGPFGHPRVHKKPNYSQEHEDNRYKTEEELLDDIAPTKIRDSYGHHKTPDYSQEYEDSRHKSEEDLLEDVKQNYANIPEKSYSDEDFFPLKVYHQGQRYPVDSDDPEDIKYPLETEERLPAVVYADENIQETRKGTREYLKHHKLPVTHELHDDFRSQRTPSEVQNFDGAKSVKSKKPKKIYRAYKLRPVYYKYKVIPLKPKKITTVYFTRPVYKRSHHVERQRQRLAKKSKASRKPQNVEDNSAYGINSELDEQYQQVRKPKVRF